MLVTSKTESELASTSGAAPSRRVELYDTTLRDGLHGRGIHFRPEAKVRILERLVELGVDLIEAGFPHANAADLALFRSYDADSDVGRRLVPFGMKYRGDLSPERDPGLQALLACEKKLVAAVGTTSAAVAKRVHRLDDAENLDQIHAMVRFLVEQGREVLYLAAGFFRTYRTDREYALKTLDAARAGGATRLVLCDSDGGSVPMQVLETVAAVRRHLDDHAGRPVVLGFHGHDDCGVAQANALLALQGGATHLQGTVNGLGDRCGSVDLVTLAANLALKMGYEVLAPGSLVKLPELSRLVYDAANLSYRTNQPYVGDTAFAHKAGMHVWARKAGMSGADRDVELSSPYEHVSPEAVGNRGWLMISALAGKKAVVAKFRSFGITLTDPEAEALRRRSRASRTGRAGNSTTPAPRSSCSA